MRIPKLVGRLVLQAHISKQTCSRNASVVVWDVSTPDSARSLESLEPKYDPPYQVNYTVQTMPPGYYRATATVSNNSLSLDCVQLN